jgi:hypothetical protein
VAAAIGPFRPCTTTAESRLPRPVSVVLPRGHYLSIAPIARSTFGTGAPKVKGGISHARNSKIQKMSPCVQFFRLERSLIFYGLRLVLAASNIKSASVRYNPIIANARLLPYGATSRLLRDILPTDLALG